MADKQEFLGALDYMQQYTSVAVSRLECAEVSSNKYYNIGFKKGCTLPFFGWLLQYAKISVFNQMLIFGSGSSIAQLEDDVRTAEKQRKEDYGGDIGPIASIGQRDDLSVIVDTIKFFRLGGSGVLLYPDNCPVELEEAHVKHVGVVVNCGLPNKESSRFRCRHKYANLASDIFIFTLMTKYEENDANFNECMKEICTRKCLRHIMVMPL